MQNFSVNRGREACHAVANSILLNPDNPIMRRNRLFYSKTYERTDLFEPTEVGNHSYYLSITGNTFLQFTSIVHMEIDYKKNDEIRTTKLLLLCSAS